jgi:hypothetical protein
MPALDIVFIPGPLKFPARNKKTKPIGKRLQKSTLFAHFVNAYRPAEFLLVGVGKFLMQKSIPALAFNPSVGPGSTF